jgi:hypothetical protein
MLIRSSRGYAMLHSQALAQVFQGHNANCRAIRIADAGPNVVQFLDRARDQKTSRTSPLDCYLEGWADANLGKDPRCDCPPTV